MLLGLMPGRRRRSGVTPSNPIPPEGYDGPKFEVANSNTDFDFTLDGRVVTVKAGLASGHRSARAGTTAITGKKYFEAVLITRNTTAHAYIGIATAAQSLTQYPGRTVGGVGWATNLSVYHNNVIQSQPGTVSVGARLMIAYDDDTGNIWFGKDGEWLAGGNPATGVNPTFTAPLADYFPTIGLQAAGDSFRGYFVEEEFQYALPSGFAPYGTSSGAPPEEPEEPTTPAVTDLSITWASGFAAGLVPENTPSNTVLGTIVQTGGPGTLALDTNPDGKVAIQNGNLVLVAGLSYADSAAHGFTISSQVPGRASYSELFTITVGDIPVSNDPIPTGDWRTDMSVLRETPDTLIAPVRIDVPVGSLTLAEARFNLNYSHTLIHKEQDYIMVPPNAERLGSLTIWGGRRFQFIGGHHGRQRIQILNTIREMYFEGVYMNMRFNPVASDAIGIGGDPGSGYRCNFIMQRSALMGVYGQHDGFTGPFNISTITVNSSGFTVVFQQSTPLSVGRKLRIVCPNNPNLTGNYTVASGSGTTWKMNQYGSYSVGGGAITGPAASGSGGQAWQMTGSLTGAKHGDCIQCRNDWPIGRVSLHMVTLESCYQGFIGGWALNNDNQNSQIQWSFVNNLITKGMEPQDPNAFNIYVGGNHNNGRDRQLLSPSFFHEVWAETRDRQVYGWTFEPTLANHVIHPASNMKRMQNGVLVDAGAVDSPDRTFATFRAVMNIKNAEGNANGIVKRGRPAGGDFGTRPITGLSTPGVGYTSNRKYFGLQAPVNPPDITYTPAASGSRLGWLDCPAYPVKGYEIQFRIISTTHPAGVNAFARNGAQLLKNGSPAGGTYNVVIQAYVVQDESKSRTETFSVTI